MKTQKIMEHTLIVDDVRVNVRWPLIQAIAYRCGIECFSLSNAVADTDYRYMIYAEKKLSKAQLIHVQDFATGFIEAYRVISA